MKEQWCNNGLIDLETWYGLAHCFVNQPNFAFIFICTLYCTNPYATFVRIRSFIANHCFAAQSGGWELKNSCCRPLFSSIFDNSRENCIACCNAAGIPTKLIQPGLPAMQSTPMRPCAPPLFLKPWASLAWRGWGRGCGPGTNRSTAYLSTSSTGPSCCLVLNFFWIQCFYMPEPKRLELHQHAGHVVLCTQGSQNDLNVCSPCICRPACPVQVAKGSRAMVWSKMWSKVGEITLRVVPSTLQHKACNHYYQLLPIIDQTHSYSSNVVSKSLIKSSTDVQS